MTDTTNSTERFIANPVAGMTRDQMSKEAHRLMRRVRMIAEMAKPGVDTEPLWSLVGTGERFSNECCETRYHVRDLRPRLRMYQQQCLVFINQHDRPTTTA